MWAAGLLSQCLDHLWGQDLAQPGHSSYPLLGVTASVAFGPTHAICKWPTICEVPMGVSWLTVGVNSPWLSSLLLCDVLH